MYRRLAGILFAALSLWEVQLCCQIGIATARQKPPALSAPQAAQPSSPASPVRQGPRPCPTEQCPPQLVR